MRSKGKITDDLSRFAEGIQKSGFPHEYRTALKLKREGWSVISSKYYLDDTSQIPREIDLIAYKVSKVSGFQIYTTLIVSCKKAENDCWALLAREADHANPNTDWWPLHLWTNNKAIDYQISKPGEKQRVHKMAAELGVKNALSLPDVELFAFQVMNAKSGTVQNDKPIYDSIASLMQAQAYELAALPERRKEPAIYQFNLLTVVDADLLRLDFDQDNINPSFTSSEHYIARYIVQKKQSFSRVHFVQAEEFSNVIKDYSLLHTANLKIFKSLEDDFYMEAINSDEKVNLFIENFRAEVRWKLYLALPPHLQGEAGFSDVDLNWNTSEARVDVDVYKAPDQLINFLNSDQKCSSVLSAALGKIYRYQGPFQFCHGIPF